MPNSIQYEYISIKDASKYTGINYRTLRRYCKNGKYSVRITNSVGGNSGKKYEILIASLEPEFQNKIYIALQGESFRGERNTFNAPISFQSIIPNTGWGIQGNLLINTGAAEKNTSSSFFSSKVIPDSAKEIALAKYNVIDYWQDFRKDKKDKKIADKDFVLIFNSGAILKESREKIGNISIGSLYRWTRVLKENNNNYHSLINNYNYTGESNLNTSLTDEEKQEFIELYYNDSRLDLGTAYSLLKFKASKLGKEIKSVATYRRFAKYIERNHYDFDVLAREGEKALKDKVVPSIRRDTSFLQVGDILVADGNKLDFMVINPFTGKPARAIMVVFQDWYSKDFVGWEIMFSENTQCISSALRNAIIRLGKFPKVVYMDNGRAFRSKYFTNTETFAPLKGIYSQLGINTVFAKPYNGKAKIVERSFGDFVKSCPPLISSYIGSSIAKQPAHLKRNEKFHKELHKNDKIPTIEQAKMIIEKWLEYYRSKNHCIEKNKTIEDVINSGKGDGINIDMLDELMMQSEIRSVKRNTIKIFGHEYTSNALYGIKDKVLIKYSLFDISKLKVYSLKGEYIGEVETVIRYNAMAKYFGTATDIYSLKQAQKAQNALIKGTIKNTKLLMGKTNPFEELPWGKEQEVIPIEEKRKPKRKLEITGYENAHLYIEKKREYII